MRGVRGSILARASTENRFIPAKILADASVETELKIGREVRNRSHQREA